MIQTVAVLTAAFSLIGVHAFLIICLYYVTIRSYE